MSLARTQVTDTVAVVGGLLPYDLLVRIKEGKEQSGSKPADYRLFAKGESVRDAAERSWGYLRGVWAAYQDALDGTGRTTTSACTRSASPPNAGWCRSSSSSASARSPRTRTRPPRARRGQGLPRQPPLGARPVHLTGWNVPLDRRTPGIAPQAPQSMVQEYLNRSGDKTLWGVLSNGRQVRLLRESASLTGAAFIEFDLQAMFEGNRSDDFVLLWRLVHRTRFEGEPRPPARWRSGAPRPSTPAPARSRSSARASRRRSPSSAPASSPTPTTVTSGIPARPHDDGPRPPPRPAAARLPAPLPLRHRGPRPAPGPGRVRRSPRHYEKYFSTGRLRRLSYRPGSPHGDQWEALSLVIKGLGDPAESRARPARPRRPLRTRPTPTGRLEGLALPTVPVRGGEGPRRHPRREGRPPRARSTTGTSARTSSARSTSRCSNWNPASTTPMPTSSPSWRATTARPPARTTPPPTDRLPPRLRARPGYRTGGTLRHHEGGARGGAARRHHLRPRLRQRPLPGRRCPPDRPPDRRDPHRRPRTGRGGRRTPCAMSSPAASTASTSTRWRSSSPRSHCGWRPWNRASRSPSSTRTSSTATACSARRRGCSPGTARRGVQGPGGRRGEVGAGAEGP